MPSIQKPQDIYDLANQNRNFFNARDIKITTFRDLVRQIDWKQREKSGNYHSFEGNESGSFYNAMVQILSKYPIRHRLPYERDSEESRELKGSVERLIVSTYRDIDAQRPKMMESVKLQTAVSQFELSDGWIAAEVKKQKEPDKPLVDIKIHDNLESHGSWGPEGLYCVVFRDLRTRLQIGLEYPDIDLTKRFNGRLNRFFNWTNEPDVEVYCCYYMKDGKPWYCTVANGQWAIEPYALDWIDEIPVSLLPVNGLPFRSNRRLLEKSADSLSANSPHLLHKLDWTQDAGRGIFHMNEDLYATYNELWATVLDLIDTEARGTYWKRTKEGEDTDFIVGRGRDTINPLAEGEEIGRLPPGQMSNEVVQSLNAMAGMLQRGGISWQMMGQPLDREGSGFYLGQLISAAMTIATPFIEGLQTFYEQMNQFIIKAYQSEGGKTRIRTWRENVSFVEEEIDLDLLKDKKFYFECRLKPGLPDDLAAKINTAAAAKQSELLDDLTILDEVLGVDDPELIIERKDEMQVLNLPTVKLRRMAAQMIEQGNMTAAAAVMQELMLVSSQQQLQEGQLAQQLQQLQGLMGMQNPGDTNAQGIGGVGLAGGAPNAPTANEPSPPLSPLQTTGNQPGAEGLPPEALPNQQRGIMPQMLQELLGRLKLR